MKTFTKEQIKDLRIKLNNVIEKELLKNGVTGSIGNASFDSYTATFKLNLKINSEESKKENYSHSIDISKLCYDIKLEAKDFDRTYIYKNKTYKLIEVSSKSRNYPFILKEVDSLDDNKRTKFSKELFKTVLEK